MRLIDDPIQIICQLARQVAGSQYPVRVLGLRLDDSAHLISCVYQYMSWILRKGNYYVTIQRNLPKKSADFHSKNEIW